MPTELSQDIGQRLRDLRNEAGLSQAEVGQEVGLSRSAVTQIELGNRSVSAEEVIRFSTALGRSLSVILGRTAPEPASASGLTGDRALSELLEAEPSLGDDPALEAGLRRMVALCQIMTGLETEIGLDVRGTEVQPRRVAPPRTPWEATHQGFAAADEERRRIDLGSTPIRDVAEVLAMLRVRTAKLPLPRHLGGLFLHGRDTGTLIVVDEMANLPQRRFRYAHGLAHALFDRQRGWFLCHADGQESHHEVRANAFASRFLIPVIGLQRYLQSIGRDTLAQSQKGVIEIFAGAPGQSPAGEGVRVSGRARRGSWELNHYELAQLAHYFGVSEALVAYSLSNQRHVSIEIRDKLTGTDEQDNGLRARRAMRLSGDQAVRGHDAFVSRLIALAVEARQRGALSTERLESILPLLGLEAEERKHLLKGV
jgi:Zn-dependent peptidase ImmA (M78 family)/transcriptional regulator with XRE-family HTH domain